MKTFYDFDMKESGAAESEWYSTTLNRSGEKAPRVCTQQTCHLTNKSLQAGWQAKSYNTSLEWLSFLSAWINNYIH